MVVVFFFKQKTAYELRISDWSSDVCSSDLRFAWRGDLFEFTLLRKLADLYVQQNRQRDALLALREAVTNFPDGPVARNAAQRMREVFASIYHGPGDPEVPPLRALALYQEFIDRKSTRLNSSH